MAQFYLKTNFSKSYIRFCKIDDLSENKTKGFIYTDIISDKAFNVLVQERLGERIKVHFDSVKKVQLSFGLESRKAKPKALSIVKVDRVTFRVLYFELSYNSSPFKYDKLKSYI